MKDDNTKLIEKACNIISNNLGDVMAGYYKDFYKDKSSDLILLSLEELLIEMVGEKSAKKQMKKLKAIAS